MAKKRAAYVDYALHNRKKYEHIAGRKGLSVSQLIDMASSDWKNESDVVKDHFKAIAKGVASVVPGFRHETSSTRLDTEAPVVSEMAK